MDIEFQRMKERLETIHLILDDMQVCNFLLSLQYCGIYILVSTVFVKSIYIWENEIVWNVVSMSAKCITSTLRWITSIQFAYRQIFWLIIFHFFLFMRSTRNESLLRLCMHQQKVITNIALEHLWVFNKLHFDNSSCLFAYLLKLV